MMCRSLSQPPQMGMRRWMGCASKPHLRRRPPRRLQSLRHPQRLSLLSVRLQAQMLMWLVPHQKPRQPPGHLHRPLLQLPPVLEANPRLRQQRLRQGM